MKYRKILLTGSSGRLGQVILNSGYFPNLLAPARQVLDITKPNTIQKFFSKNDFDAVIHCAAIARMVECENNPLKAVETNAIGTSNLAIEVLKKESQQKNKIRFVLISTDGVYEGTKGNYSEKDPAIPYNIYGWTKLGAECAVNLLSNFCIIRTSFFEPDNIKFDTSAVDAYSSKVPVDYLVKAIAKILFHKFTGTINIGSYRISEYQRYKRYKASLKPCKFKDIAKAVSFTIAKDASMDCTLWKRISKEK